MRLTNRLGLPEAIVRALMVDEYDRGAANISVTGLTSPPRLVALREAHDDELTEDVSDLIFALLGKAVHKILEVADADNPGTITEKRYFMRLLGTLGEWVVSGQMDSIELEADASGGVVIKDWKTAKVAEMKFGVKVEREQQLNVYKVLLELAGYNVIGLQDIFILRDWSKVQAAKQPTSVPTLTGTPMVSDYPDSQVVVHDVRMWSHEEAGKYIMGRLAVHQQAQAAYNKALRYERTGIGDGTEFSLMPQDVLPECDDEERWARPASFAAIKHGAKVASRLFDTEAEAEAYAQEHTSGFGEYYTEEQADGTIKVFKGENAKRASKTFKTLPEADAWIAAQAETYDVQARPGESIRCEFYCPVSSICQQWAEMRRVEE